MIIAICGSFAFAKQMLEVSNELSEMGHTPILPVDIMTAIDDPSINQNIDWCINNDVIRDQLSKIIKADAILVLNCEKSGIKGYIGGSTLIELGFAHYFKKKIFLLFPIPDLSYSVEIRVMQPIILDGNLKKIE
jgi:hypothetical protein